MGTESTTEDTTATRTWVAFGAVGAVGSVYEIAGKYFFRLLDDADYRGVYPTLETAKRALYAAMKPGSDRPEFREH